MRRAISIGHLFAKYDKPFSWLCFNTSIVYNFNELNSRRVTMEHCDYLLFIFLNTLLHLLQIEKIYSES